MSFQFEKKGHHYAARDFLFMAYCAIFWHRTEITRYGRATLDAARHNRESGERLTG